MSHEPPDLFSTLDDPPHIERVPTVAERFEQFHAENPAVLRHMIRIAREWRRRTGSSKVGVNGLIEQVRWRVALATSDPDFKINNVFGPFYSRLIAFEAPDLADAFECRRSIADEWIKDWIARHSDRSERAA
jgi:hypothetical protein